MQHCQDTVRAVDELLQARGGLALCHRATSFPGRSLSLPSPHIRLLPDVVTQEKPADGQAAGDRCALCPVHRTYYPGPMETREARRNTPAAR
jgi:hypothetical protein